MTVCIFCPTGRTFTFEDCEIVTDNESMLVLAYTAMSDGRHGELTVLKSNIIGWSTKT